jgi:phage head maturation protease
MPFLARSVDLGGFREVLMPSAFTKTLQESPALAQAVFVASCGVQFRGRTVSFHVIRDNWRLLPDGNVCRELAEVRLVSVSAWRSAAMVSRTAREAAVSLQTSAIGRKDQR